MTSTPAVEAAARQPVTLATADCAEGERRRETTAGSILLSAVDLAREFRVSIKTVRRMDQAGKLPMPVRLGGRVLRWRRDELVEWLAAGAPDREEWMRFQRNSRSARKGGNTHEQPR